MNNRKKKLTSAINKALIVGSMSLLVGNVAWAQDSNSSQDQEVTELDRVQVTGSRLKRAEIEGATPVIVITRESIDASGDVSVADVLRDATFASTGNFKPQSGSSAQSLATINLRGMSSGRTLVLVDGRRAPTNPMSASSGSDLNAIPLAAVERIEILSDGASAIYGSDAIGGVVNIILRKDFNGAEIRYGKGFTKVEGGDLEDVSAVVGVSSDRGRLFGGASKNSRDMVYTRDQIGGQALGVSGYGNNYLKWGLTASGNLTYSVAAVPGFDCPTTTERNADYPFWKQANGRCSFDFNATAANEAAIDNTSVFVMGDYQITDDWSVYLQASTTNVKSFGRYAPVPGVVRVEDGTPNDINDNPALIDPETGTDGLPTYFYHRFAAAGNRDGYTDAHNADFLVGFRGQLTENAWLEFGARRTNYDYNELGYGYVISSLANAAANSGDYMLNDPYGATQATLNGFTATIGRDSFFKTKEYFANIAFDLFEMGGGTSNAIVGAEFREEMYQDRYDSLSQAGVVLGSAGGASAGDRTVGSAFFEWLFPFATSFDVSVAGRFDKYNDYGSDFSPKVSARWHPIESLTFRGSWGQGFRAPGLDITTQADSFSAESVVDPVTCQFFGLDPECKNAAGVQQSIQVDTFFVANPGLSSEQSDQFSLGVVWDPVEWLDFGLDYYNIKLENAISQISPQDIINMELEPETYGNIPPGLSITRHPGGHIDVIIAGYGNAGETKTSGLDFTANTNFDLAGWGRLRNRLQVSHVLNYDQTDATGFTADYVGLGGFPEYRAGLYNEWSVKDFTVNFNTNFIGKNGSVGGYATNDLQLTWRAPWNARISIGANNIGDRYPVLSAYDGRPWNFYLYDAYGRTTYFRYVQSF